MTSYLIDPLLKDIISIEWSDENTNIIFGYNQVTIGARFYDGDILYCNGEDDSDNSEGFMLSGTGYIRGKALIVGTNNNGSTKDVSMNIAEALSFVLFEKDPFIQWYEDFLINEKIDLSKDVVFENWNVPLNLIFNSLSTLSDANKNEIRMMVHVDRSNGISPQRLLRHFAQKLIQIGEKDV